MIAPASKAKAAPKRAKKVAPTVYTVVVTREKDGRYVVCAPALDYCGSYGDTLPEALRHAEEAIALYLEGGRELGWPNPPDDPHVCVDMTGQTEVSLYRLTIHEGHQAA
jgi:predicted RNase H-like HicB family nuclease